MLENWVDGGYWSAGQVHRSIDAKPPKISGLLASGCGPCSSRRGCVCRAEAFRQGWSKVRAGSAIAARDTRRHWRTCPGRSRRARATVKNDGIAASVTEDSVGAPIVPNLAMKRFV